MSIATSGAPECKPAALAASPASAGFAPSTRRDAHYFILQTHSNAERAARAALEAPHRGCKVVLPLERATVVHARRRRDVERAFLPCYLFVKNTPDLNFPLMRTAPGVSHVVKCGDQPAMMGQRFIDRLEQRGTWAPSPDGKRTELYIGLEQRLVEYELYLAGEEVRVTDGPFASFDAIFEGWTRPNQRAQLLVQIFGRKTPVELELNQFEKL